MGAYSVGASGFQIVSVGYSSNISAFIVDVAFSRNLDSSALAFFVPRSQIDLGGSYTAQFNNTYSSVNFPCSIADLSAKAATTCCLSDFVSRYHVTTSFMFLPGTSTSCTSPDTNPPPLTLQNVSYGGFGTDMPASRVAPFPTLAASTSIARFTLALSDLSNAASVETSGGSMVFKTFVGIAQFAVVPGSRILDSSSTQSDLTLVYNDFYQVM